jgi:hypothetical protein
MKCYIEIELDTELPMLWDDDAVSQYITFATLEDNREDCVQKNGVPYVSYETLDVGVEGYTIDIIDSQGAPCTHVIPEGRYGLHPTLTSLTQSEFDAL